MLLSARSQLFLTTVLLLLAIGSYISIYSQPSRQSLFSPPSGPQAGPGGGSSTHPPSNLALVLNPGEHANREPHTLRYVWKVTSDLLAPDGVSKRVYLINGMYGLLLDEFLHTDSSYQGHFPGPLIEARSGDEIVVEVHNDLENEGTAIHWHGLSMRGKYVMYL